MKRPQARIHYQYEFAYTAIVGTFFPGATAATIALALVMGCSGDASPETEDGPSGAQSGPDARGQRQ